MSDQASGESNTEGRLKVSEAFQKTAPNNNLLSDSKIHTIGGQKLKGKVGVSQKEFYVFQ